MFFTDEQHRRLRLETPAGDLTQQHAGVRTQQTFTKVRHYQILSSNFHLYDIKGEILVLTIFIFLQ